MTCASPVTNWRMRTRRGGLSLSHSVKEDAEEGGERKYPFLWRSCSYSTHIDNGLQDSHSNSCIQYFSGRLALRPPYICHGLFQHHWLFFYC